MNQVAVDYRLDDLENELIERVRSTTTFRQKSFSIYSAKDLVSRKDGGIKWPMAGVAYEGMSPVDMQKPNNRVSRGSASSIMVTVEYSVIIALEYSPTGSVDSKQDAFALLDEVRKAVLGYRGVNAGRPWAFKDERPLETETEDKELEGVIFYGQLWSTEVPLTGSYTDN